MSVMNTQLEGYEDNHLLCPHCESDRTSVRTGSVTGHGKAECYKCGKVFRYHERSFYKTGTDEKGGPMSNTKTAAEFRDHFHSFLRGETAHGDNGPDRLEMIQTLDRREAEAGRLREELAEAQREHVANIRGIRKWAEEHVEKHKNEADRLKKMIGRICDDYHQECLDTTGSDCSVDRRCERQDNCWVTRIRKALDTPTPGEGDASQ